MGLAGSGDLYVTCVGGRNGRFGQLLGSGASPAQALRTIGSTVEGVANTAVALDLAARYSIDLPTARAVDLALREELTDVARGGATAPAVRGHPAAATVLRSMTVKMTSPSAGCRHVP